MECRMTLEQEDGKHKRHNDVKYTYAYTKYIDSYTYSMPYVVATYVHSSLHLFKKCTNQ